MGDRRGHTRESTRFRRLHGLHSRAMKRRRISIPPAIFMVLSLQACASKPALQITDTRTGEGDAAQTGDTVDVHYTGWLYENGKRTTQFDSSVGQMPLQFTIGQGVIDGWSQGLVGMKVGGKRELIIPPELGYGEKGAGGVIPPNATLDFEIELLKLTKGK